MRSNFERGTFLRLLKICSVALLLVIWQMLTFPAERALSQAIPTLIDHQIISSFSINANGERTLTPKEFFTPEDSTVMSHVQISGPYGIHEAHWEFYNPDGQLDHKKYKGINTRYMEDLLRIKGWPAASQPGQWTVKFFIKEVLQFEDHFTIQAKPGDGPPPDDQNDLASFDENNNGLIDNAEFFLAVDGWVTGEISDQLFLRLVDAWIAATPIAAADKTFLNSSFRVYDLTGRLISSAGCESNPRRAALRLLSQSREPQGIYILLEQDCLTGHKKRTIFLKRFD